MLRLDTFNNDSFSRGTSKFTELAWLLTRSLLFATWLPVPSSLKVKALRFFGAKVGQGVVIRSRVNISFPWRLEIGDHVWLGDDVTILSLDQVKIGSHSCISQKAFLCTGSHDYTKPAFDLITKPITIGEGAWVCASCFVAPGVTVANGAVCVSGAVVSKDVEANMIVGGNPARVIKQREEACI